jgi:molybdopterin-containing oxidoreductase family molybdopterin binding subunit
MSKVETEIKGKPRTEPTTGLTRRGFVAALAAAAGTAALTGTFTGCSPKPAEDAGAPVSQAPPEDIYQGVCRGNCGGGCRMNVHVRDGKVVKTSVIKEDNPLNTRICQKGLSHAQRIYAPERLEYPMRRKEGTPRGGGEWERLTWDEAISYICDKWKGYIEEAGPTSIGYCFGAGTYALNQYIYMRLFNMIGATNFELGYDMGALEQGWHMYGMATFLIGNNSTDTVNAKYIFNWACNATIGGMNRWVYLREALKNNDGKLIVIDPIYTDIAAKADIWVPIKPATDGALALAMIKTIIDEGLQDDEYMAKHTVAPFLVKTNDWLYLKASDLGVEPQEGPINPMTGQPTVIDPVIVMSEEGKEGTLEEVTNPTIRGTFTVNGIEVTTAYDLLVQRVAEWTPEKAAEICEISADLIRELARLYAEGPTTLNVGFGNDHWGNGQGITHGQLTLPLITGQIGKPGTGVSGTQGQSGSGYDGANMAAAVFPQGAVGGLSSTFLFLPKIMETGMYGEMPLKIKSLFNFSSNLLACHSEREKVKQIIDQLDLFVTVDTIMNDTSNYADVVLPLPHWFEYETCIAYPVDLCLLNEKAIEPQFECKDDIEIARLLGLEMGFGDTMDLTTDDYYNIILDTDIARGVGLTWDNLKKEKGIRIRPENYMYGSDEIPFVTATGRGQFFLEDVTPKYNYGQQLDKKKLSLPFYEEPLEAYDSNPLRESYPLTIISHRDKFKVHSSFAPCPWFTEIQPEPSLEINPLDAEARGIADGDYVKVFNDRGYVVMKAFHDASMRPGVVWTEHTWLENQYKEGHYAQLTSMATTEFLPTNSYFDTLCQVEKV